MVRSSYTKEIEQVLAFAPDFHHERCVAFPRFRREVVFR